MGFFAGFVEQMRLSDDREERRKEFMQTLMENRRNTVIPYVLEQISKEADLRAAETQRISYLTRNGLSIESAVGLQRSGQLERVTSAIQRADEAGKLDPNYISELDAMLTNQMKTTLGEENYTSFSNAIAAGLTSGDSSTEEGRAVSVASALSALWSADDPLSVGTDLIERAVSQRDSYRGLPSFTVPNINTGTVEAMPTTERARVESAVTKAVAAAVGSDQFTTNPMTGDTYFTGTGSSVIPAIITTLTEQAIGMSTGPSARMSGTDAVQAVITPITQAASAAGGEGYVPAEDLLRMVNPGLAARLDTVTVPDPGVDVGNPVDAGLPGTVRTTTTDDEEDVFSRSYLGGGN